MKDYKRYTKKDWAKDKYAVESYKRLAELEDKIENGTLIEIPCIMQDCYGDWCVCFYSDKFKTIDCYKFSTKEKAEAKLRELKGEQEK